MRTSLGVVTSVLDRARLLPLCVLVVLGAIALALPVTSAGRSSASAGSLAAMYRITIGVKGGESWTDSSHPGVSNGDKVTVTASGSYVIDGAIPTALLIGGTPRPGLPTTGGGYSVATVNGTWSARGTKWVDVANKVTGPYTCSGTISAHVSPQMQLSWKKKGAAVLFKLEVAQQELYADGLDSCPSGVTGGPVSGATDPIVFETRFSVPYASIGNKTITAQVAGPLAENRKYFLQNCAGDGAGCNMAWHGVVRFTLTRLVKYP